MTQKIKIIKRLVSQFQGNKYVVRRGSHKSGGYIYENALDNSLEIGLLPGDNNSEDLVMIVKIASNVIVKDDENHIIEFSIKNGFGCSLLKGISSVEVIAFHNNTVVDDPFLLDKNLIIKNIKVKIYNNTEWNKITLSPRFETHEPMDIYLRFNLSQWSNLRTRVNDFVAIKNLTSQTQKKKLFSSFITPAVKSEVIFPNVRLINRISKKNNLIVTFAPLNTPQYVYNTLDMFYGGDESRLIINDHDSNWYLGAIDGLGNGYNAIFQELSLILKALKPSFSSFFGISMGAYAALLYGSSLNAKRIAAYNPELTLMLKNSRSLNNMTTKINNVDFIFDYLKKFKGELLIGFSINDTIDRNNKTLFLNQNYKFQYLIEDINTSHNLGDYLNDDYTKLYEYLITA